MTSWPCLKFGCDLVTTLKNRRLLEKLLFWERILETSKFIVGSSFQSSIINNNICHWATEQAVVPELMGVLQHPEHPPGYATGLWEQHCMNVYVQNFKSNIYISGRSWTGIPLRAKWTQNFRSHTHFGLKPCWYHYYPTYRIAGNFRGGGANSRYFVTALTVMKFTPQENLPGKGRLVKLPRVCTRSLSKVSAIIEHSMRLEISASVTSVTVIGRFAWWWWTGRGKCKRQDPQNLVPQN